MANVVELNRPVHVAIPRRRYRFRASALYALVLLKEFRWTLMALGTMILIGALLYRITPLPQFGGGRPDGFTALYAAWMAMLAQPITDPPEPWYLVMVQGLYPVFGFILIGEGVVRLAILLMSRRHGEKEWMQVMASTCRDHVVLCGLGHLGFRVYEHLAASNVDVVVIEIDETNRFVAPARAMGACILIRDMKDDQALIDAGIERAAAVIVATNNDIANIEVAMDARRMNKGIRILLRLFDQQIAEKIAGAMTIDAAFSASALAAPLVAAMSLQTKVVSGTMIGGVPHMICELQVQSGCPLVGKRIDQIEMGYGARILARTPKDGALQSPPSPATTVMSGDVLTAHTSASQLTTLAAAARAESAGLPQPASAASN